MALLVTLFYLTSVQGADTYLSHYEINLDDGNSVKTVRTASQFTPGTPVVHVIGDYELSLTIDVVDMDRYTLTVSVAAAAGRLNTDSTLLHQSFDGWIAGPSHGPLEFSLQQDTLRIYGAFTLSNP